MSSFSFLIASSRVGGTYRLPLSLEGSSAFLWRGLSMPKGPRGEKRPADAVGRAVMVAKIATGEIEDERELSSAAAELGRKGGKKRAENMTPERRKEIAKKAAAKRWSK